MQGAPVGYRHAPFGLSHSSHKLWILPLFDLLFQEPTTSRIWQAEEEALARQHVQGRLETGVWIAS